MKRSNNRWACIHEAQSIPEEKQAFTFYGKRFIVLKRLETARKNYVFGLSNGKDLTGIV